MNKEPKAVDSNHIKSTWAKKTQKGTFLYMKFNARVNVMLLWLPMENKNCGKGWEKLLEDGNVP